MLAYRPQATAPALDSTLQNMDMVGEAIEQRAGQTLAAEDGMARFDLTDFEWSVILPLLPNKPRGVARVDDRRVLNGIFWRLRTGRALG